MTILCTIDLLTREVFLPADQRIASYDHNVDVIRFQAEPIEDFSLDLSSIKIAAQGPNKARHDYAVNPSTVQIEEETGYITFDWPIPAGVTEMPIGSGFKYGDRGQLIFAVCAEIIDGSTVSKAWHSDDGIITVVAHLEPESGGGEDPEEEATNAQKIGQLQTDVAVINTQVGALANGTPPTASTIAEMDAETSTVYIYTGSESGESTGYWYYYNGTTFVPGGQYGGAVTDTTLSISGKAADAKAVGDALAEKADADEIGDLSQLETTDKSSIVAAINEAAQSGGSGTPEIDVETDVAQTLPWEQGTINPNGTPGDTRSTRVRNSDFVEIESGCTELRFEITSGYKYCVYFYDENESVISGTPHYDAWMTETWTLTEPFTYAYYKVLLAKKDNGSINPSTGPSNIQIFVTQKVPIDLSEIKEMLDAVEPQISDEALTLTSENYDFGWRWGGIDGTLGGDIIHQYKSVNRTDFIRVGEGTVVEYDGLSNYGITVHCYDENKAYIGNSGNNYVRQYRVSQDGYIRIQLRAGATDSATIEQDKSAVTILRKLPAGFIKDLIGNGGLPSYYDTPIKTAVTAAKADMVTAGMTGDSFIFFSDVHWPNNTGRTYKVVDRVMQDIPTLQNVFNCGDTINAASDADESIPAFMKTHLPKRGTLYNLVGNHDIYVSNARLYAELLKHFEYKVVTGGFGYYYFDNGATKTRYICLNTKGQGDNLGTAQLAWLNAILDSMPDGYNALVFAHILYNFASDWHDAAVTAHGTQIANACDTFNTNNANKKVFAIFGGHVHVDLDFVTPGGIPIILIDNNGTNTCGPNTATAGTITETVLDIVTVDYSNKTIKCERIGRGTSRSFTI